MIFYCKSCHGSCPYGMILYTIWYHIILCAALVIHNTYKKYRLTIVTSQPQAGFTTSQWILLLFWSHMSTIILIITSSWWYDQIYMGRKTTEFSFLWDHRLRFWTPPNSDDPGRRVGPFLTLPTLFSHSFHLSWQWVEVGVFVGQKRWALCTFPFFMQNLYDSPFSCHLSKISCKHATIKFETLKEVSN